MRSAANHISDAIVHEKAGRWTAAKTSYAEALRTAKESPPMTANPRAKAAGLTVGAVLHNARWGKIRATCEYVAEGQFRYNGTAYPSLDAAARAASSDLGLKGKPDAWHFWGVEKRESPSFTTVLDEDDDGDEEGADRP